MIKEFVERWEKNKNKIKEFLITNPPKNYGDIVGAVVTYLTTNEPEHPSIDPQRIHMIDDGDYQGTLLFVIAAKGYQPYTYYYCKIHYGSCSGCDTLQDLMYCQEGEDQINGYMQLALHIVQNLKEME